MIRPFKNPDAEAFVQELADAIYREDADGYEKVMQEHKHVLDGMVRWEVLAFRDRCRWLVEQRTAPTVHRVAPREPWARYPFPKMEPGDSVFFPGQRHTRRKSDPPGVARAATAARTYACRTGKRFTARQEAGGVRIARLPDEPPSSAADLFD